MIRQSLLKLPRDSRNSTDSEGKVTIVKSLSLSRAREKHLASIYRLFRKEGALNEFVGFYHDVQQQFALPVRTDNVLVQAHIDLNQYNQGRPFKKVKYCFD